MTHHIFFYPFIFAFNAVPFLLTPYLDSLKLRQCMQTFLILPLLLSVRLSIPFSVCTFLRYPSFSFSPHLSFTNSFGRADWAVCPMHEVPPHQSGALGLQCCAVEKVSVCHCWNWVWRHAGGASACGFVCRCQHWESPLTQSRGSVMKCGWVGGCVGSVLMSLVEEGCCCSSQSRMHFLCL